MQIRKSDTTASLFPNMIVSGPQWSLYPLLAIIAFCEFACGMVHLSLCLPFYFLLLPLISGTMGLVASFHAVFLRYPNRTDFILQLIAAIVSFIFFFTSLLETYCLSDFTHADEPSEGVCHGVKYRTVPLVNSCTDFIGGVQNYLLEKLGWNEDRERLRFGLSCALTLLAAVHLFVCSALTIYSGIETKLRAYSYHYQCVVGGLLVVVGLVHWRYCCTFFFLGLPFTIGVYAIIQGSLGTVTWRHHCDGPLSRSLNIGGAALAALLSFVTVFGIFCWSTKLTASHPPLVRHCHWRPESEEYCIRVIHFSVPYIDWLPHETDREMLVVQMIVYSLLLILSALQFAFSMKSAFSLRNVYLYY